MDFVLLLFCFSNEFSLGVHNHILAGKVHIEVMEAITIELN